VWVRDYRGRAQLLVNEIGRYRGQVLGPRILPGLYILEVRADGPYVVKFSRWTGRVEIGPGRRSIGRGSTTPDATTPIAGRGGWLNSTRR
jgi:hypothetical protein